MYFGKPSYGSEIDKQNVSMDTKVSLNTIAALVQQESQLKKDTEKLADKLHSLDENVSKAFSAKMEDLLKGLGSTGLDNRFKVNLIEYCRKHNIDSDLGGFDHTQMEYYSGPEMDLFLHKSEVNLENPHGSYSINNLGSDGQAKLKREALKDWENFSQEILQTITASLQQGIKNQMGIKVNAEKAVDNIVDVLKNIEESEIIDFGLDGR